jgi:hypothetical protein
MNRCYPFRFKPGTSLSIGHWQTDVNGATQMLRYNVVKNFKPVSLLADTPMWIAARSTLPAKDLKGSAATPCRRSSPQSEATRAPQVARAPLNRLPPGLATNLPAAHLCFFFNGAQKAGSR